MMELYHTTVQTMTSAALTALVYFGRHPDKVARARQDFLDNATELRRPEVLEVIRTTFAQGGPTMENQLKLLDYITTLDCVAELDLLNQVLQEALRYEPPIHISNMMYCKEDTKLGEFEFRKGDCIAVNYRALHRHAG